MNKDENKKKKQHNKTYAFIIICGILMALFITYVLSYNNETPTEPYTEPLPVVEIAEDEPSYITETCYDGSIEIDPVVFKYPFQKTSSYKKNKDIIKLLSEDDIKALLENAITFANIYYGVDNKVLVKDYNSTEEKLLNYYSQGNYLDEKKEQKRNDIYVADFLKMISDASLQTDIKFITDKSLIFEDMCWYVRGLITLTVHNINPEIDISAYYPFELQEGMQYQIVVDIGFYKDNIENIDYYRIASVDIQNIKKIESANSTAIEMDKGKELLKTWPYDDIKKTEIIIWSKPQVEKFIKEHGKYPEYLKYEVEDTEIIFQYDSVDEGGNYCYRYVEQKK